MMKNKSFAKGSAALLAILALMSGKASAMQPVMQPVVQQPMMQPVMYPAQQLNVKEQMMLQDNSTGNQIVLQNNNADNTIKVQDNYFKNMKDYRDSDPFTKWTLRTLGAAAVATVADIGAGAYATGNLWWFLEDRGENLNAAKDRDHMKMYNIASKAAVAVGSFWTAVVCVLRIVASVAK